MTAFQIVLPTHNRVDHLVPLLESLTKMEGGELLSDVFVIENGSAVAREATLAFADRLPVTYRHAEDGNKSKALNGILPDLNPNAPTLYLDDDVLIPPKLLVQYAAAIAEFGEGHYYGGPTTVRYEVTPDPKLVPYMPVSNRGFKLNYQVPTEVENQSFLGTNWVCFAKDVLATGGYNPSVGPGIKGGARGQETEMQQRLRGIGRTAVYVPGEPVSHWVPERFVQKSWILDRLENTNKLRGRQSNSSAQKLYWWGKRAYHAVGGVFSLDHRCRHSIYKGLTTGSKEK